jgi:hypothetical protein
MAVCVIAQNPKGSPELYEEVVRRVAQSGAMPPPGAIFQVAGQGDGGWLVVSVWESREAYESFAAERLEPIWSEHGISRDDLKFTVFEAHSYMAGDLSSAAQPG